ncbi:unnamed protein product [Heligmosomoides polygyrus]|uniref:C-type lectin domain-containing protein n=1 Tax=Heligmosomoides polygyrus TaxID=6339 RepID=A0A3P8AS16_HELPZ|nr:unnamed protein product [Heligmosomoides polygyrus]
MERLVESDSSCAFKAFVNAAFDQAETVCQSTGGHLASIHSDQENTFVSSKTLLISLSHHFYFTALTHLGIEYKNEKQLTFIGLTKPNYPANSTWTWSDGTIVDYLLWAPGKPSDTTGLQNCAQVCYANPDKDSDFRRWNDVQCSTSMRAYVCKQAALH